jgi:L-fucose isomerase
MKAAKIGVITFGDPRPYTWENYFKAKTLREHQELTDTLSATDLDVVFFGDVVRTKEEAKRQADELLAKKIETILLHIPTWTFADLVVVAARRINLPCIVYTNNRSDTTGTVGMLASAGALDQVNIKHCRIRGDIKDVKIQNRIKTFARAAAAVARLQGETYGVFGGRSLGMYTGTADTAQWQMLFGVDTEHIDQLEIIRESENIPEESVNEYVEWLEKHCGSISYNDTTFTKDKLKFQVRCYLATKKIIKEKELDFISIKCQTELSENYVAQCLTPAFLPNPYDLEGEKTPVMCSCEADCDGALTMQIIKHITGEEVPVLFMDTSHIDENTNNFFFGNCGGMATWYANRASSFADNLKDVHLMPIMRNGGGACTYFNCAPGPITLARLVRIAGNYRLLLMQGEIVELTQEEKETFTKSRGKHQLPMAFIKMPIDTDEFIQFFNSNHIVGVLGDYAKELEIFTQLVGIDLKVLRPVSS